MRQSIRKQFMAIATLDVSEEVRAELMQITQ
jgi:hypothetical protein